MDGCSLEDAFPGGPYASPGCTDRGAAEVSRRQEKKKARRCRGPQLAYLDGGMNMVGAVAPDRQANAPVGPGPDYDPTTGVYEHKPTSQQYNYETFVGAMDDLPEIRKDASGPNALQKGSNTPSFFGANPDDSRTSIVARKTEGFQSQSAPYVNVIGNEEGFRLEPDFAASFGGRGAQKAAGGPSAAGPSPVGQEDDYLTPTGMMPNSILPVPNVDVFWKENGLAGGQSAFFSSLKAPGGKPSGTVNDVQVDDVPFTKKEVLSKLDRIFARLDDMESGKSENAQTEVLLFILTGLGVIFLMDVGCRAVAGRR
jgi:hypothetical protein